MVGHITVTKTAVSFLLLSHYPIRFPLGLEAPSDNDTEYTKPNDEREMDRLGNFLSDAIALTGWSSANHGKFQSWRMSCG